MNMNTDFTVEETNLISIYRQSTRKATITHITHALPYTDSKEMRDLAESAVGKLSSMTDEEYDTYSFDAAGDETA